MSLPFKLYRLQQIDSHNDRVRTQLDEIENRLADTAALRLAEMEESTAKARLQAARKALLSAEENVKEQRIKIETNESTLYGGKVRNPKELQDLQNDIASLKKYLSVLEDRQLDAMIAYEDADQAYQSALQTLEKAREDQQQKQSRLIQEKTSLQSESEHISSERQAAVNTLGKDELSLYENLRKQKNGIAVVKIVNKSCSACGSTLNASLLQAAASPNQVSRCDTCGRILYSG
jgi:hypothetical protein